MCVCVCVCVCKREPTSNCPFFLHCLLCLNKVMFRDDSLCTANDKTELLIAARLEHTHTYTQVTLSLTECKVVYVRINLRESSKMCIQSFSSYGLEPYPTNYYNDLFFCYMQSTRLKQMKEF